MRDYVLPAATFQQEFQLLAQAVQQTLYTCVIGPKRKVVKDGLSPDTETFYGSYNPDADTALNFLGLPAGEKVDAGSVEVRLDNVYGRYAQITDAAALEVGSSPNRISVNSLFEAGQRFAAFSNNAAAYTRFSGLGERDVREGDYLKVTHQGGTLITQVSKLIQERSEAAASDAVAGAISAADANDSANPATSAATSTIAIIDSVGTGRVAGNFTVSQPYDGDLAGGYVTDVYTVEITKGGALGVAEFRVISRNGDNVSNVLTPATNVIPVAVGTKGVEILMNTAAGPFVVGEKIRFTVKAAYSRHGIDVVSEVYTGLVDTTYQIKVVKGGTWASGPKVSVTTNNNIDSSGAVVVSAIGANIQLGKLGPVVEFSTGGDPQGGLRLGDIYLVRMSAAADDGARTLSLRHPLPQFDGAGAAINAAGYDLDVDFLVRQVSHEIPAGEYPDPGDVNWELSVDRKSVSLKSGIEITDPSVVDGGELKSLLVVDADVSIFYTAPLALEGNRLGIISNLSQVAGILGDVVPENEVAFGVDIALRNSGGSPVYYLTTAGGSIEDYTAALGIAEKNDDLYFMVPMSHNIDVQSLLKSHVISMSSEVNGLERIAILNRTVASNKDLFVRKQDGTSWSGYIAAGPELAPTQYRQVSIPGADFVAQDVRPGDILRVNFAITASNSETYETFVIEDVIDEENLLIAAGPAGPVGGVGNLHRIEVVHPYTSFEKAELAAAQSEFFGDRRVTNVFPDEFISTGGQTIPGFYLAAAYAGLKSSVVAHQPITNVELSGVLSVPKVLNGYTREELNEIAGGGTMIVGQELEGGKVYVRHSITTDMADVNQSELQITTNVDAITKYLRQWIRPLIGQYNITPEFLIMLETLTHQRLDYLIQETQTVKAGPQIINVGTIRAIQDPDVRTKVLMTVPLTLPYAANNIVTKLVIV